jgi:hypothetical protein
VSSKTEREREEREAGLLTRGEPRSSRSLVAGRSPPERGLDRQRAESQRAEREKRASGSVSGWRLFCPVHTGQRTGEGDLARAWPVHRTVHSAVSGAHRTVR